MIVDFLINIIDRYMSAGDDKNIGDFIPAGDDICSKHN